MKRNCTFVASLVVVLALTSCNVNRYVAPPFTDVERILKLKTGASMTEVTNILGIKPYDVVHSYETGSKILIYNYRVKDQSIVVPARSLRQTIHSEEVHRGGEDWYNTNYRELFLLFKDEKLAGIYGERMFGEGSYLELIHERLTLEGGQAVVPGGDMNALGSDYMFLQNVSQERFAYKQKASIEEDETIKKRRRTLGYIGLGLVAIIAYSLGR